MALFSGSGVALVTPFTEDGVDFELLDTLLERQLAAGTDALIVLGTTGEPCTMTQTERFDVIRFAVERVRGRAPVIAGAGANDTRETIARCRMAREAGADALLVVTPYYNKATQDGLVAHFEAAAKSVDIPLILYNVPSRTGLNMLPETVARLAKHPRIQGFKEASTSIAQLSEAARLCQGDLRVYAGNDDMALAALSVGASGVISVTANVVPDLVKRMTAFWFSGDTARALSLHRTLAPLTGALFSEVSPIPVKAALALLGFGDGRLRPPLTDITPTNLARLREAMEGLLLI